LTAQPLRVGICGYGLAGRYFHGPFLRAAGFNVVGVTTKNPQRQADLREDFPSAIPYDDVDQLLGQDLDLLVVASANSAHASEAIAGLRAGVAVVVDKPMGRTHDEAQSIASVANETGSLLTTFFNRRWDSDALTIKKAIKEGILGNVFRIDSRFERFRPEANPDSWRERSTPAQGGGNLLDLQPHLISLVLDWFGPAKLVHSSVRSIRGLADDDVVLVLKHDSGVDSYLSASAIVGAAGPRIRMMGDKGALIIHDLDKQEPLLRSGMRPEVGGWKLDTTTTAQIHRGEEILDYSAVPGDYTQFYLQVAEAIRGNGVMPVSIQDALDVAFIVDQAREISIR
jgi:scyllo-inositol 2-dehydrogenase (NADP+)